MDVSYRFSRGRGHSSRIALCLDDNSLESGPPPAGSLPAWAALDFEQCPHCPLEAGQCSHCPLAARLAGLMQTLGEGVSHERMHVEVRVGDRTVRQTTTAQRGLSALLGLVVATSGCPHTVYLKPMARFHLPFASEEETVYRAVTMYLLACYFRQQQGEAVDFRLEGLTRIYEDLQVVNAAMARRLRAAAQDGDVAVNALVLLDMYAKALPAVVADKVDEVRYLFRDYLEAAH